MTNNISVDFFNNIYKSALIGATCIFLAAGCSNKSMTSYTGVEPNNRNEVEMVRIAYVINFVADTNSVNNAEITKLHNFLNNSDITYGDELSMDFPLMRNGDLSDLNKKRLTYISAILKNRGIYMAANVTPYGMEPDENTARLLISKYVVTPPTCGDWSQPSYPNYNNTPTAALGCATQANLGLMVANPRDLITGQKGGPVNAERAAQAIERYQTTTVTVSQSTASDVGN